jgi:hypothetical protein
MSGNITTPFFDKICTLKASNPYNKYFNNQAFKAVT